MKITSLLALSALMTAAANAQLITQILQKDFENITFMNATSTGAQRDLYGLNNSGGESTLTVAERISTGVAGIGGNEIFIVGSENSTWNETTTPRSQALAYAGLSFINFNNMTLPVGHTLNIAFDVWGAIGNTAGFTIKVGTTEVASLASIFDRSSTAFTASYTNNTGADLTGAFQVDVNGQGTVFDNMQIHSVSPIPEPSAALLGAFGALALLRRRRA